MLTTITITIITDNLYLDMNGIVHSTTHGNDGVTKKMDEKLMMLGRRDAPTQAGNQKQNGHLNTSCHPPLHFVPAGMFQYIDNIVKIVRPIDTLYMAIDGVAPRAKLNQQRCVGSRQTVCNPQQAF